jgi:ABC-2 type transport system permease protein/oleandomycin transport system permease protein
VTPRIALLDIGAITKRNLLRILRTPRLLVFSSIQPVMFVLLFRYVFAGAIHAPGSSYVDYLMPGIFVQTALFGGASTAVGLASDLQGGIIDRFRSLPMARSAVLAGRTIADLIRNVVVLLLMVVVGVLVGFRFHGTVGTDIAGLAMVLLFGYAFSWVFATIGLIVKDPETAQVAGFLPLFPLVFASSAFVPVHSMPGWLQAFANVQPVSVTVDATRALVTGGPVEHWLWQSLVWAVGILVLFALLAVRQYRKV